MINCDMIVYLLILFNQLDGEIIISTRSATKDPTRKRTLPTSLF